MKSSHWSDFVPANSKIDGFYGGLYPRAHHRRIKEEDLAFAAITYRLQVAEAENGYHHFIAMYTAIQGAAWTNGCLKEACRPGYYQFVLHFLFPRPWVDFGSNYNEGSHRATFLYGQDAQSYGADDSNIPSSEVSWTPGSLGTGKWGAKVDYPSWINNKIMDVMVFRPSLVDPTNIENRVDLWTPSAYDGQQMYFTGFPLVGPGVVTQSDYEL